MHAAVLAAPRRLSLSEVPAPTPGPGQVLVAIRGAGVCGSELAPWEGREWFTYPFAAGAPGHEGWGVVAALGAGVRDVAVDSPVAVISEHAHAEYDLAAAENVVTLPEALGERPFPGEPLACAVNAFDRAGVEAGGRVAILGCGFLGLLLVQLSAAAGARVTAVSRRASSRRQALAFGAQTAWSYEEASEEEPFDVVVEATGAQAPLDLAARLTRVRGRLVIAGYHQDGPRTVDMQLWNWRGLDVINAHERDPAVYTRGLRTAVTAVSAGRLRIEPLLTHRFALEQIGEAFAVSAARPEGFVKAVWTASP